MVYSEPQHSGEGQQDSSVKDGVAVLLLYLRLVSVQAPTHTSSQLKYRERLLILLFLSPQLTVINVPLWSDTLRLLLKKGPEFLCMSKQHIVPDMVCLNTN